MGCITEVYQGCLDECLCTFNEFTNEAVMLLWDTTSQIVASQAQSLQIVAKATVSMKIHSVYMYFQWNFNKSSGTPLSQSRVLELFFSCILLYASLRWTILFMKVSV